MAVIMCGNIKLDILNIYSSFDTDNEVIGILLKDLKTF